MRALRIRTRTTHKTDSNACDDIRVDDNRIDLLNLNSLFRLNANGNTSFLKIQADKTTNSTDYFFRRSNDQNTLNFRNRTAITMGNSSREDQRTQLLTLNLNIRHLTRFRSIRTILARNETSQQQQINLANLCLRLSVDLSFLDRLLLRVQMRTPRNSPITFTFVPIAAGPHDLKLQNRKYIFD